MFDPSPLFDGTTHVNQGTLKWLRFATPGLLVVILAGVLGLVTGAWNVFWPDNPQDYLQSTTVLALAAAYYITPLRAMTNQPFFDEVSENLRRGLVRVAGIEDDPSVYTWQAVRGVFYHFVDSDKSLSAKASLAYFNGFIWTTLADLRALSFLFSIASIFFWFFGLQQALVATVIFATLIAISHYGSITVTARHKEIGNEQIEIIEHKYRSELTKMLQAIRDRSNPSRNS